MEKESSYTIFTDASFYNETNISTYSIIVKKDSKTTKIISRKPIIKMTSSVECEIFTIYQAINLILSAYINKSKIQNFKNQTIF